MLRTLFDFFFHRHKYSYTLFQRGSVVTDGGHYAGHYETYRLTCTCGKIKLKTLYS